MFSTPSRGIGRSSGLPIPSNIYMSPSTRLSSPTFVRNFFLTPRRNFGAMKSPNQSNQLANGMNFSMSRRFNYPNASFQNEAIQERTSRFNTSQLLTQFPDRRLNNTNSNIVNQWIQDGTSKFNTPQQQTSFADRDESQFPGLQSLMADSETFNPMRYSLNSTQESMSTNFLISVINKQAQQIEHLVKKVEMKGNSSHQSPFNLDTTPNEMRNQQLNINRYPMIDPLASHGNLLKDNNYFQTSTTADRFSTPIPKSRLSRMMFENEEMGHESLSNIQPYTTHIPYNTRIVRRHGKPSETYIPGQVNNGNYATDHENNQYTVFRQKRQGKHGDGMAFHINDDYIMENNTRKEVMSKREYMEKKIKSHGHKDLITTETTKDGHLKNINKSLNGQNSKMTTTMNRRTERNITRIKSHKMKRIIRPVFKQEMKKMRDGKRKRSMGEDPIYRPPHRIGKMLILPRLLPLRNRRQPKKFGNILHWDSLIMKKVVEKDSPYLSIHFIEIENQDPEEKVNRTEVHKSTSTIQKALVKKSHTNGLTTSLKQVEQVEKFSNTDKNKNKCSSTIDANQILKRRNNFKSNQNSTNNTTAGNLQNMKKTRILQLKSRNVCSRRNSLKFVNRIKEIRRRRYVERNRTNTTWNKFSAVTQDMNYDNFKTSTLCNLQPQVTHHNTESPEIIPVPFYQEEGIAKEQSKNPKQSDRLNIFEDIHSQMEDDSITTAAHQVNMGPQLDINIAKGHKRSPQDVPIECKSKQLKIFRDVHTDVSQSLNGFEVTGNIEKQKNQIESSPHFHTEVEISDNTTLQDRDIHDYGKDIDNSANLGNEFEQNEQETMKSHDDANESREDIINPSLSTELEQHQKISLESPEIRESTNNLNVSSENKNQMIDMEEANEQSERNPNEDPWNESTHELNSFKIYMPHESEDIMNRNLEQKASKVSVQQETVENASHIGNSMIPKQQLNMDKEQISEDFDSDGWTKSQTDNISTNRYQISASGDALTAINNSQQPTRLQLPNGTTFKVVRYVPPKEQKVCSKGEKMNDSSTLCRNPSKMRRIDEQSPSTSLPQKFTISVKGATKRKMNEEEDTDSKWLSKNAQVNREKQYKFRYLNSFHELQEDKKWMSRSKAKIFGEQSCPQENSENSESLEVTVILNRL